MDRLHRESAIGGCRRGLIGLADCNVHGHERIIALGPDKVRRLRANGRDSKALFATSFACSQAQITPTMRAFPFQVGKSPIHLNKDWNIPMHTSVSFYSLSSRKITNPSQSRLERSLIYISILFYSDVDRLADGIEHTHHTNITIDL